MQWLGQARGEAIDVARPNVIEAAIAERRDEVEREQPLLLAQRVGPVGSLDGRRRARAELHELGRELS